MMLKVDSLTAAYGRIEVLHDLSLEVDTGEIVAIVGANGAGKTTLMKVIAGVHPAAAGRIVIDGDDMTGSPPHKRVGAGVALVPEGRQVFSPLSVADNLALGAFRRAGEPEADRAKMESLFPILKERTRQAAGSLSGGQQQMLAIARALMSRPRLLLLDEPSMGLAPIVVKEIFQTLSALHREVGTTILLVEQNVSAALGLASRGYVMETGRVVASGASDALLADPAIQQAYLGG
ncbi:MAG: ABC transporter ATP-binding protein [Pseudomonadota bacterium]